MRRYSVRMLSVVGRAAVVGVAIGCAGCASEPAGPGERPKSEEELSAARVREALQGTWMVKAINGRVVDPSAAARMPTFEKREAGRVGGLAGVNHWSSTLDEDALGKGRLELGPVTATLMAGPPAAMALERQFLSALETARSVDTGVLGAGTLRLLGEDGAEVLRFGR